MVNKSIKVHADCLTSVVASQDPRERELIAVVDMNSLGAKVDDLIFCKDFDLDRMYSFTSDIFNRCELEYHEPYHTPNSVSVGEEDTTFCITLKDSRSLIEGYLFYYWWLVIDFSCGCTHYNIEFKVIKEGDTIHLGFFNK